MEQERSEEEAISDDDWAALRAAVPSFSRSWLAITRNRSYDRALPFLSIQEFATHIVERVIREYPEELQPLADAIEDEFTVAARHNRERYAGFLRVGLLEGLIHAADESGMPLTRIVPLLRGSRTRENWYAAVAYQRPGRVWDDTLGAVPTFPLAAAVCTIEITGGRRLDDQRFLLEVRLIGGDVSKARFIRRESGKDFWLEYRILNVSRRSADLPNEMEVELESDVRDGLDEWEHLLPPMGEPFWQLADGASWPELTSPNESS